MQNWAHNTNKAIRMAENKNKGRSMFADKNLLPPEYSNEDRLLGVHNRIAEQLRAFYSFIQEEEIPQRFLTLLEQLDEVEQQESAVSHAADSQAADKQPACAAAPRPGGKSPGGDKRRSRHE